MADGDKQEPVEGWDAQDRGGDGQSPLDAAFEDDAFAERPHLYAAAAFAGGFVIAKVLGRFGDE